MKKLVIAAALVAVIVAALLMFLENPDGDSSHTSTKERSNRSGPGALHVGSGDTDESVNRSHPDQPAGDAPVAEVEGDAPAADPLAEDDGIPRRTVQGVVVNSAGETLADAQVRLIPVDSDGASAAVTTSGEAGAFHLRVPTAWRAGELVAELDTYERATLAWTAPESGGEDDAGNGATPTGTEQTATPDRADSTTNSTVDPIVITLVHETALAGVVTDRESGEPCVDFLVAIQRFLPQWPEEPRFERFQSEDGRFYFGPLGPGNYKVWAYQEGKFRTPPIEVTLVDGEFRDDLEFALEDGHSVTGAVYSKRTKLPVSGAIVYSPKQHLPGTVNWIERTELAGEVRDAARTDEEGRFTLEDLAPGESVVFRVLHADYAPADFQIDVLSDGDNAPVEVALRDGNAIRGTVLDDTGAPLVGAGVMCFSWGTNPDFDRDLSEGLLTTVDEHGEYELRNLNPAQYFVFMMPDLENPEDPGFRMSNARLGPDDDVIVDFVELKELATLTGRVLDESGRPLPDMNVSASTISDGDLYFRNDTTDADGRYEIRNLRLDQYSVHVAPAESQNMPAVGEIQLDQVKTYERDYTYVDLQLSGRITYESGQVPPYSEIVLLSESDSEQSRYAGMVWTDEEGRYQVSGLRPGTYRLMVTAAGHVRTFSETAELDTKLHRRASLDVSLPVGARVAVRVLDATDEPVVGVLVYILDTESRPQNQGLPPKTDATGQYSYSSLAPGDYTVSVIREGTEPVPASFKAEAGKTATVQVRLP